MSEIDTSPETVRKRWGTFLISGTFSESKTHLTDTCRYATGNYREVDAEALPPSHIDLCKHCIDYYKAWHDGLSKSRESDTTASEPEYAHRPDPNQPYRFRCPDCDSCRLYASDEHIRCKSCGETHSKPELVDAKR